MGYFFDFSNLYPTQYIEVSFELFVVLYNLYAYLWKKRENSYSLGTLPKCVLTIDTASHELQKKKQKTGVHTTLKFLIRVLHFLFFSTWPY